MAPRPLRGASGRGPGSAAAPSALFVRGTQLGAAAPLAIVHRSGMPLSPWVAALAGLGSAHEHSPAGSLVPRLQRLLAAGLSVSSAPTADATGTLVLPEPLAINARFLARETLLAPDEADEEVTSQSVGAELPAVDTPDTAEWGATDTAEVDLPWATGVEFTFGDETTEQKSTSESSTVEGDFPQAGRSVAEVAPPTERAPAPTLRRPPPVAAAPAREVPDDLAERARRARALYPTRSEPAVTPPAPVQVTPRATPRSPAATARTAPTPPSQPATSAGQRAPDALSASGSEQLAVPQPAPPVAMPTARPSAPRVAEDAVEQQLPVVTPLPAPAASTPAPAASAPAPAASTSAPAASTPAPPAAASSPSNESPARSPAAPVQPPEAVSPPAGAGSTPQESSTSGSLFAELNRRVATAQAARLGGTPEQYLRNKGLSEEDKRRLTEGRRAQYRSFSRVEVVSTPEGDGLQPARTVAPATPPLSPPNESEKEIPGEIEGEFAVVESATDVAPPKLSGAGETSPLTPAMGEQLPLPASTEVAQPVQSPSVQEVDQGAAVQPSFAEPLPKVALATASDAAQQLADAAPPPKSTSKRHERKKKGAQPAPSSEQGSAGTLMADASTSAQGSEGKAVATPQAATSQIDAQPRHEVGPAASPLAVEPRRESTVVGEGALPAVEAPNPVQVAAPATNADAPELSQVDPTDVDSGADDSGEEPPPRSGGGGAPPPSQPRPPVPPSAQKATESAPPAGTTVAQGAMSVTTAPAAPAAQQGEVARELSPTPGEAGRPAERKSDGVLPQHEGEETSLQNAPVAQVSAASMPAAEAPGRADEGTEPLPTTVETTPAAPARSSQVRPQVDVERRPAPLRRRAPTQPAESGLARVTVAPLAEPSRANDPAALFDLEVAIPDTQGTQESDRKSPTGGTAVQETKGTQVPAAVSDTVAIQTASHTPQEPSEQTIDVEPSLSMQRGTETAEAREMSTSVDVPAGSPAGTQVVAAAPAQQPAHLARASSAADPTIQAVPGTRAVADRFRAQEQTSPPSSDASRVETAAGTLADKPSEAVAGGKKADQIADQQAAVAREMRDEATGATVRGSESTRSDQPSTPPTQRVHPKGDAARRADSADQAVAASGIDLKPTVPPAAAEQARAVTSSKEPDADEARQSFATPPQAQPALRPAQAVELSDVASEPPASSDDPLTQVAAAQPTAFPVAESPVAEEPSRAATQVLATSGDDVAQETEFAATLSPSEQAGEVTQAPARDAHAAMKEPEGRTEASPAAQTVSATQASTLDRKALIDDVNAHAAGSPADTAGNATQEQAPAQEGRMTEQVDERSAAVSPVEKPGEVTQVLSVDGQAVAQEPDRRVSVSATERDGDVAPAPPRPAPTVAQQVDRGAIETPVPMPPPFSRSAEPARGDVTPDVAEGSEPDSGTAPSHPVRSSEVDLLPDGVVPREGATPAQELGAEGRPDLAAPRWPGESASSMEASEVLPTDTLPTDTLPTDTLPTDTLPTDTLPTDTLPTDTLPGHRSGRGKRAQARILRPERTDRRVGSLPVESGTPGAAARSALIAPADAPFASPNAGAASESGLLSMLDLADLLTPPGMGRDVTSSASPKDTSTGEGSRGARGLPTPLPGGSAAPGAANAPAAGEGSAMVAPAAPSASAAAVTPVTRPLSSAPAAVIQRTPAIVPDEVRNLPVAASRAPFVSAGRDAGSTNRQPAHSAPALQTFSTPPSVVQRAYGSEPAQQNGAYSIVQRTLEESDTQAQDTTVNLQALARKLLPIVKQLMHIERERFGRSSRS